MILAPGISAGVNRSMEIDRARELEQMRLATERQRLAQQATEFDNAQQDRQRQMRARTAAGGALYGLQPPGAMPPPGAQPPPPGQSSAPMRPPMSPPGGGQPMMAPGVPQFSASPQAQGQPPGMRGAPTQPDPRMDAIRRCQTDLQALQRELQRPGLTPDQKSILTGEQAKTQDQLAKLTGQPAPYRAMPQPGAEGPAQQPQPSMTPPPPVGAPPQQPSLLMQIVGRAKQNGVPPDQLMDMVDTLSPVLKNQLAEELAAMRGTQMSNTAEIRALTLGLAQQREERIGSQSDRRLDQGDRRLDQGADRVKIARERAQSGQAPTASELSDPETARIFYDIFKTTGKTPPFAWGKVGEADRSAWMKAVKQFSKDDGQDGGDVAGTQAAGKANASALTQNTKDLAAIRPYKVMLDKNANVAIDLGRKLQVSDSALANRPIQWLQKNAGSDPNLREYLAQIQIVQTEAARVLNNPRLTGQLTDSARHEMQDIIKGTMPLADTERVLRRMMQDGENRVKALESENGTLKRGAAGKSGAAPGGEDEDAQAIAWAKANPKDPRAVKIMKLHGM